MKSSKMLVVFFLVFTLLVGITACGSNETASSEEQEEVEQQTAVQEDTDLQAAVEQVMPTADSSASVDSLIGSWIDIDSNDRFANITKTDTGYQYEDNEGKYPATFEGGVLKVKVSNSEGDTADVYIDAETGHMLVFYQDSISEHRKK